MLIRTGLKGAHNNKASSFYTLDPKDGNHGRRMRWMREQGAFHGEEAYPASDRLIGRHSPLPVKVTAAV
jgi:hypothetical protein